MAVAAFLEILLLEGEVDEALQVRGGARWGGAGAGCIMIPGVFLHRFQH